MALTRWTPARERFDLQVEKGDGCWYWKGTVGSEGYGQIGVDGRKELAHRFAYVEFVGPITKGMVIDHLCGVRTCVNPDHLEVVAQATNVRRGRLARLTEAEADEIRRAEGTQSEIGRRYGVSQPLVSMVKSGQRWAKEAA